MLALGLRAAHAARAPRLANARLRHTPSRGSWLPFTSTFTRGVSSRSTSGLPAQTEREQLSVETVLENALVPNEARFQTTPRLKPMQFFNSFAPYSDFGYPHPPYTVLNSPTLLAIQDPLLIYHKVFLSPSLQGTALEGVGRRQEEGKQPVDGQISQNPQLPESYDHRTYSFPNPYTYESPYYYETAASQLVLARDFVPAFHDPFGNLGKVDFEEPLYVDIQKMDQSVATRIMQLYGNSLTMDERLQLSLNMTAHHRRRKLTFLACMVGICGFLYYYAYTHTEYQAFDDIPMPPLPEPPAPAAAA